jgi:hypothetical protein
VAKPLMQTGMVFTLIKPAKGSTHGGKLDPASEVARDPPVGPVMRGGPQRGVSEFR